VEDMVKINRKAQSAIEYAMLFGIVVGAFVVIQAIVNRSVQGRLKQIQDELNEPVVDENGNPLR
jgi:Flp pilus assembly pilin Flp